MYVCNRYNTIIHKSLCERWEKIGKNLHPCNYSLIESTSWYVAFLSGFPPSNLVFFLNIQWNSYFLLHIFNCRKKWQDEGFKEFFKDLATLKKNFPWIYPSKFFFNYVLRSSSSLLGWLATSRMQIGSYLERQSSVSSFFQFEIAPKPEGLATCGWF